MIIRLTCVLFACVVVGAGVQAQNAEEWRTVRIAQGPVRGQYDSENDIYAFYNIPYATAPVGSERFKAPLAPPTWTSPFDAVDRGIVCPQAGEFANMQEDCLVANIFIPKTEEINLPVLVNIHPGAYQLGFGNEEGLNSLASTKKVIAVSFNYRLGALGFLCLGTEGAPGNAGLKDQVALLRWIKQNIASFGGNPEDVTLYGCSAGGGSVDILTLSNIAQGLFNKAIIGSGVSSGGAGVQYDTIDGAKNYARLFNFTNVDDIDALEQFYKTATVEQLIQHIVEILSGKDTSVHFGPCFERDLGQERVIADAPVNIINNGNYTKIPILYGFANMEGLLRRWHYDMWIGPINDKFSDFLPAELEFDNEDEKELVAAKVKKFYYGEEPINEQNFLASIDFFSDQLFIYPLLRTVSLRLNSSSDTMYLYEYSFVDENTPYVPNTNVQGADHCSQSVALFDEDTANITEEYANMKTIIREIILNFILTSSPVPEGSQLPSWPPVTASRSPHMSLGRTIQLKNGAVEERATFWDSIYENHYRMPTPPNPVPNSSTNHSIWIFYLSILFYILRL